MNRHTSGPALTLRVRAAGEANREGVFLTPASGIVRATVYGGPKSRLRAYVAPFQSGTLYLYAVRSSFKVSDFDVSEWRPELRESLDRSLTALSVCDALISGWGGGAESEAAFRLACESLDALRTAADGAECEDIRLSFLWRWLDILGLLPELDDGSPLARLREGGLSARERTEAAQTLEALLREGTGRRGADMRRAAW